MQVEFSHTGDLLAAAWADGITRVYDAETSAPVAHFGCDDRPGPWANLVLAFSSDDSLLASGGLFDVPVVIHQLAAVQPTCRYAIAKSTSDWGDGPWHPPFLDYSEEPLTLAAMSSEYVALVRGKLVVVQLRATGEAFPRHERHVESERRQILGGRGTASGQCNIRANRGQPRS